MKILVTISRWEPLVRVAKDEDHRQFCLECGDVEVEVADNDWNDYNFHWAAAHEFERKMQKAAREAAGKPEEEQ